MDPPFRRNGSTTKPVIQAPTRGAGLSRVAGRVDRVLNTALAGERAAVLNVTAAELLAEPVAVAGTIEAALDRPGMGLMGHWMVHELFRRSQLYDELVNSLASPNAVTRAAAARICGAPRMTDSVPWLSHMGHDSNPPLAD